MDSQHNSWIKLLANSLISFKKPVTITTVPCKTLRLVLPYLGTHSLRLKKRLNKLLKEQLPSGNLENNF